ncbi:MAG: hypothetical protein ACOYMZ_03555 [Minisyncoccia bacterium]
MTIEEIEKLVDGDPDVLIQKAEELGIDLGGLNKGIAKEMVKKRFSLTEEHFEAVDFVFWIAYFVEREAEELIIDPEVHVGARKSAMEALVSKLHFGDKIKIIEELHTGKKDEFVKLMRKIQDMRNDVAHGRFNDLNYGGYNLSDNRAKIKLIGNLRDVLRKKK